MAEKLITTSQLKRLLKGIADAPPEAQQGDTYTVKVNGNNYYDNLDLKTAYTKILETPFIIEGVCLYQNKICIVSTKECYLLENDKWVKLCDLPVTFYTPNLVVYNGSLNILGQASGTSSYVYSHYRWNGTQWVFVSTIPYKYDICSAVVFNNKIHIFGSNDYDYSKKHYSWDGSDWNDEGDLTFSYLNDTSTFVYDNKVYLVSGYMAYIWDGTTFNRMTPALSASFSDGVALIYKDELHLLDGDRVDDTHYYLNSTNDTWEQLNDLPCVTRKAIVYNNKIYMFDYNSTNVYVYNDSNDTWDYLEITYLCNTDTTLIPLLPYDKNIFLTSNDAIEFNNKLHIFGNKAFYIDDSTTIHYTYSNNKLTEVSGSLPFTIGLPPMFTAVVYNNALHVFNTYDTFNTSTSYEEHYIYDGSTWTEGTNVFANQGAILNKQAVVYRNKLYFFSTYRYIIKVDNDVSTQYNVYNINCYSPTVYDDKLYAIDKKNNKIRYCDHEIIDDVDDSDFVILCDIPVTVRDSSDQLDTFKLITYDNELHLFCYDKHYVYRNSELVELNDLPYEYNNSFKDNKYTASISIFRNELYLIGGNGHSHEFHKWNPINDTWTNKNI